MSFATFAAFAETLTPLVAALVATLGGVFSALKVSSDLKQRRLKELADAQARAEAQEAARREELRLAREKDLARADETVARRIGLLADTAPLKRLSAGASLRVLLDPRYRDVHDHLIGLLIANLNADLPNPRAVEESLVRALERFLAVQFAREAQVGPVERRPLPYRWRQLKLARCRLAGIDLQGLDFGAVEVDIAFAEMPRANLSGASARRMKGIGARLRGAVLRGTFLKEARMDGLEGFQADFREANLISATLKGAHLAQARFAGAHLQAAHFEGADLSDADFAGAILTDAYFRDCVLNASALASLRRAVHWQRAHFDPDHRAALAEAA